MSERSQAGDSAARPSSTTYAIDITRDSGTLATRWHWTVFAPSGRYVSSRYAMTRWTAMLWAKRAAKRDYRSQLRRYPIRSQERVPYDPNATVGGGW